MKRLLMLLALLILIYGFGQSLNILPKFPTDKFLPNTEKKEDRTVVYEESTITTVVEETLPAVVTIGILKNDSGSTFQVNPSDPFSLFRRVPQQTNVERNIGSGFIVSSDGLIITGKHVVADTNAKYKVLTNDKKTYNVEKIYRDPLNDLAILKINAKNLKALSLGDSKALKLGQLAIAVGTPLGEFTNTVTTGIVSGLGRGITAGSPFEGYVEKLDNVIQTDAAVNPGNSGGPLLNSKGQVIGVNVAIAEGGQNIGFAIPVNVVKDLIDNFQKNGSSFERPYLGIRYKFIDGQTAVLNDLVQGAYIIQVIASSPADKAGIRDEDVITTFDGKKVQDDVNDSLIKMTAQKKVGDRVALNVWRSGQSRTVTVTLESAP
ncbi:hypothetical protein A3G67_03315 [Candidatus Roizmanbacteria bacterium RIFCSPLOWO2_12_FULL_40_12]|uniref:PDZ domain-containing protein n=1 Tax=Candidatus Roizmanbacteria bacterium RIFCSPLOWO2_01_FULL_40_42 TaxID=1802066 RepID=A0A1F7J5G9_9BACT|nr:MAG: hypothetical protein A2779_02950 [Candidatus Roizmanbacteria bacterium RIFCSPHIGHO2_01_FULL_40_98]OGK28300.1 MAG: hypothetical protein A3C31_00315 [Candidatus Roizmanbacteria bacterium RIFCSPHIGHO2_02_FULL_40_53]OGK30536.1 MAG: hypothetical protein A2W49_03000 [Candidatus Roizmanbacteria bacterium RIFCSPHIGHO2_12_41_18]OGK36950.1 MAG: hypothetical protein A3E69_00575 [Candidatus Roizmanbacteria bacterium RIFCSPHIGHO2_12_FULL_40_130]OGK50856.1 MAG: hypothetical protein A3B50_01085 [Candi